MTTRAIHHRPRSRAFTLAELIVATIILVLVVSATTMSISQMLRSRDAASSAGDAFGRAQLAAVRIATDAGQALRDAELINARVAIVRGGPAGKNSQGLLLFTHMDRPVRTSPDSKESDEYEVQYRLEPATLVASAPRSQPVFTLWRRADPIPDEVPDGGGVAAPIADGVTSLTIDAYDGSTWRTDWDSDSDGYPHALRITVAATGDDGRRTATARRVVAFDRTPKPALEEEPTGETGESATQPTTSGSTGGTGTTGGTGGGGGGGTGGGGTGGGRTGGGGTGGGGTGGGGRTGGGR